MYKEFVVASDSAYAAHTETVNVLAYASSITENEQ